MTKISVLPQDTAPTTTDYIATVDSETTTTKKVLLSDLLTLFFNQTAIPAGGGSPVTREAENHFDHVASGGVWTGDALASTRNASMTAMICYINGRRISITAVTARNFTASKDTYADVLDNQDGTGALVYTEVTNNAASPALAANSLRIGIIVTGATTIAAAGSINQGQEDRILPIASSIAYTVTDSLGNLICGRDPNRLTLGYKQLTTGFATASGAVQITGLSVPFLAPAGRKIEIWGWTVQISDTTASNASFQLWNGPVNTGAQISLAQPIYPASTTAAQAIPSARITNASGGLTTINGGIGTSAGTVTLSAASTWPLYISVKLA